jgi:signal peptidase I
LAGTVPTEPAETEETRSRKRRRWALEWLAVVLIALGVAIVVRVYVVQTFFIPSASMEPTLMVGDRILVDKLSYHLHGVGRGDIVVFARPPLEPATPGINDLVKRVIGLPGETVTFSGGRVWIEGRPLREPWLPKGTVTTYTGGNIPGCLPAAQGCKVPPGHYFVMGDNRGDSEDSRFFGPIPRSLIVGRVFMRIWPISRAGFL